MTSLTCGIKYTTQTNISMKQKQDSQRSDLWLPTGREVGEERIGSLGLAEENYYIHNV